MNDRVGVDADTLAWLADAQKREYHVFMAEREGLPVSRYAATLSCGCQIEDDWKRPAGQLVQCASTGHGWVTVAGIPKMRVA